MSLETKNKILDAAEELFANKGFKNASIRDITREAGVNVASVHYHFQGKRAVIAAVIGRLIDPLNKKRLDRLEALKNNANGVLDPEDVLRALLEPTFQVMNHFRDTKPFFMKMVGRMHSAAGGDLREIFFEKIRPVILAFVDAFAEALPHLTKTQIFLRMKLIMGGMAHLGMVPDPPFFERPDPETVKEELIAFALSGLLGESTGKRGLERG